MDWTHYINIAHKVKSIDNPKMYSYVDPLVKTVTAIKKQHLETVNPGVVLSRPQIGEIVLKKHEFRPDVEQKKAFAAAVGGDSYNDVEEIQVAVGVTAAPGAEEEEGVPTAYEIAKRNAILALAPKPKDIERHVKKQLGEPLPRGRGLGKATIAATIAKGPALLVEKVPAIQQNIKSILAKNVIEEGVRTNTHPNELNVTHLQTYERELGRLERKSHLTQEEKTKRDEFRKSIQETKDAIREIQSAVKSEKKAEKKAEKKKEAESVAHEKAEVKNDADLRPEHITQAKAHKEKAEIILGAFPNIVTEGESEKHAIEHLASKLTALEHSKEYTAKKIKPILESLGISVQSKANKHDMIEELKEWVFGK